MASMLLPTIARATAAFSGPPRLARWAALAAVTATALCGLTAPAGAQAQKSPDTFQTSAPHAILIDADTDTVLFEKNADQFMFPASLNKLMTMAVVFNEIQEGRLNLDTEFTVSEYAWRHGGAPSRSSSMYVALHSKVKVRDLIQGVIIQSGNDACIVLAEGIAGTELAFAEMMNKRAREIGLTKSNFTNSTGLHDPDLKVTARELAELAQHLIQTYPELYKIYAEREFTWNKIRQQNRNPLLTMNVGADGLKTGFTNEAGYGLVGSAVQNGLRLIVVVNGLKSAKERAEEGRKLLEWGFKGFESRLLFGDGETIGDAKLYGGAAGRVPLTAGKAVKLLVPRNAGEKIIARIVYTGPVAAPVEKGQPIGKLKISRGDNVVLEVPLQAAESVSRGNMAQRAFDAASELMVGLFTAGVERL